MQRKGEKPNSYMSMKARGQQHEAAMNHSFDGASPSSLLDHILLGCINRREPTVQK